MVVDKDGARRWCDPDDDEADNGADKAGENLLEAVGEIIGAKSFCGLFFEEDKDGLDSTDEIVSTLS